MFESFYGNEPEQYVYYSVPKLLFTDDKFKKISTDSKLLYSFLLDRAGLSVKNNWIDEDGKVYVYFRMEELCDRLNIGKDKAVKVFNELDTKKGGIGLISRKKQGQGKPTKIYVNNFTKYVSENDKNSDFGKTEVKTSEKPKSETKRTKTEVLTSENQKSGVRKIRSQEFGKSEVSIDINPNISILTESIISNQSETVDTTDLRTELLNDRIDMIDYKSEKEKILNQIDGNALTQKGKYGKEELNELIELIAWTNLTTSKTIRINGINLDSKLVKEQFTKLKQEHISYVLACLRENEKQIKNRRNYLLTCLYNAPSSFAGCTNQQQKTKQASNKKKNSYNLDETEDFFNDFRLYDDDMEE